MARLVHRKATGAPVETCDYTGTAIKRTTKAKLIKEYSGKCFVDPGAFPKRSMGSIHTAALQQSV